MKVEITCAHCSRAALRNSGEVNRAQRNNRPIYCSRDCGNAGRSARKKSPLKWHEARFEPRIGKNIAQTACLECGRPMWLPRSKVEMYRRCSPTCNRAWHSKEAAKRDRLCETCGAVFRPRQVQIDQGRGLFCSQKCNTAARDAITSPEVQARGKATLREMHKRGEVKIYRGEDNPRWKGGPEASRRRQIESGKAAAQTRRYREKNPHRIHEWHKRRRGRKIGSLPYGTIPRIGAMQKWKCAICRVSVKGGYHVDHIMPLARGGLHEPRNLQLLCGPCNMRKNAKDPIQYMQEIGRLL